MARTNLVYQPKRDPLTQHGDLTYRGAPQQKVPLAGPPTLVGPPTLQGAAPNLQGSAPMAPLQGGAGISQLQPAVNPGAPNFVGPVLQPAARAPQMQPTAQVPQVQPAGPGVPPVQGPQQTFSFMDGSAYTQSGQQTQAPQAPQFTPEQIATAMQVALNTPAPSGSSSAATTGAQGTTAQGTAAQGPLTPQVDTSRLSQLEAELQNYLQASPEEQAAAAELARLQSATQAGIYNEEGQGRGITLNLVRGAQQKLLQQSELQQQTLQQRLALSQAKRQSSLEATKFSLQREDDKIKQLKAESKPVEISPGATMIDPKTGKVVYQAPEKITKPAIVQEYEYAKSQGYQGSFTDYQNQDANRKILASQVAGNNGLSPSQTQNFLRISDKYQADPVIKTAERSLATNAIAEQVIANPGNAGNQLKILYTLIKSLDPETAVREGELDLAQQTQSYLGRFSAAITRLSQGQLISPEAAVELARATKDLVSLWQQTAVIRTQKYDAQAATAGIGNAWQDYKSLGGISSGGSSSGGTPDDIINQYLNFNSVGNTSASAPSVTAIASAIKQVESGGRYDAKGGSGEYGAYQFMPATWKGWAKTYLGNPNAPMTPANQDKVAHAHIESLLKQGYGPREIALIWNGGQPVVKRGVNKYGVKYDSGAYANKVISELGKSYG